MVLGADLARALGVLRGDKIALIAPQGIVTPAGVIPRLKQFTVAGIFEAGLADADSGLALVHLQDAQTLYQMGEAVSGVRLKLDDLFAARAVARELLSQAAARRVRLRLDAQPRQLLPRGGDREAHDVPDPGADRAGGGVQHRLDAGDGGDRQAGRHRHPAHARRRAGLDPADLHGAGHGDRRGRHRSPACSSASSPRSTSTSSCRRSRARFSIKFLSKDVYCIPDLPSDLQMSDVVSIALMALVLSFVATIYPSWRAARVNPAEALRYE